MGSSCTTAKKSSDKKNSNKSKYQINNGDMKNARFVAKKAAVSKEAFEECF